MAKNCKNATTFGRNGLRNKKILVKRKFRQSIKLAEVGLISLTPLYLYSSDVVLDVSKSVRYVYYKEVTLPQFLQNYKETKTKFQALKNIVRIKTGTKSQ